MHLSPESLRRLREAADLRSQDVTSFVLWTALDRAADILALERRTRPAPTAPGLPDPEPIVRDPGDPDDDIWDDYRVVREPLDLQPLVFRGLRARRHQERERDREREKRELEERWAREQELGLRERDVQQREQALQERERAPQHSADGLDGGPGSERDGTTVPTADSTIESSLEGSTLP